MPRRVLPTKRWILGGALGGMWAFMERKTGRGNFLFSTRLSLDSLWNVGVKRGWWKGVKNGDVLLFTASLVLMQVMYEHDAKSVDSPVVRKVLSLLRGDGWVDRALQSGVKPPVLKDLESKQQTEVLDEPSTETKKEL
jgi:hypothetical protein